MLIDCAGVSGAPAGTQTTAAFDTLFIAELQAYQKKLLAVCRHRLGNREDAEDVAQCVLALAWRHRAKFRGTSSIPTWLFRIMTNECTRFGTQRSRRLSHELSLEYVLTEGEEGVSLSEHLAQQDRQLEATRRQSTLERAIRCLRGVYREVIELRYFHELRYEEIACRCNIPVGTVKSRMLRAHRMLANVMGAEHQWHAFE